jgi:hypothetical protein
MRKYLTPEAQKIVHSSKALTFNFIYATWNGPGWFQKFGRKFNEDVKKNLSIEELVRKVLEYRMDSGNRIIVDTGKKLEKILPNIENIKLSPLTIGSSSDSGIASSDNQPGFIDMLYDKFLNSQKASNKA